MKQNTSAEPSEQPLQSSLTSFMTAPFSWKHIIAGTLLLVIVGLLAYRAGKSTTQDTSRPLSQSFSTTTQPSMMPSTSPVQVLKAGWTTYVHPISKFSVNLPPGWSAYTKTWDPTKVTEFRSADYTEALSPEGLGYQKTGKRILFEYKSKLRKLDDYKITEQKSIQWLGAEATFIKGDGNDGTDTPSSLLLTTDVNGETYQLYWPNYDGRDDSTDADLLIEIAQSMSLGQSDSASNSDSSLNAGWKLFSLQDYNSYAADITLSYPPECTIQATTGQVGISCTLTDGRFVIYPEAPASGADIISTDSILLARMKWERRKFNFGIPCQASGTSYLNSMMEYADPLIVCFDIRKPSLESSAEDIIDTFKLN